MRHMKSLHDREQKKRMARVVMQTNKKGKKKNGALKGKELMKFNKYKAAQMGLQRGVMKVDKRTGKVEVKSRNELFQVLREIGVSVKSSDNVDADLIAAAEKWMLRTHRENYKNKNKMEIIDDDRNNNENEPPEEKEEDSHIGVLVIYSKDIDFVPLIESAKQQRFITVSMTDRRTQTTGLVQSSDIIVGQGLFANWIGGGTNINDVSADEKQDDEYAIGSYDEIDDELDEIERMFKDSAIDDWEEGETTVEDSAETNDWEEEGSTDILSGDEFNYQIRKVDNAPSWDLVKSLSASKDNSIQAISATDVGLNFMIARQGVQNNDYGGITRWHLADDSVHNYPVEDSSENVVKASEIKPTPIRKLRRVIMARDSMYIKRDGGTPREGRSGKKEFLRSSMRKERGRRRRRRLN
jgi:hypothetical protein